MVECMNCSAVYEGELKICEKCGFDMANPITIDIDFRRSIISDASAMEELTKKISKEIFEELL